MGRRTSPAAAASRRATNSTWRRSCRITPTTCSVCGASAATSVSALAQLAREAPGTTVLWVTRRASPGLAGEVAGDPLPAREALATAARALQGGSEDAVTWVGGAVLEGLEYNSGTHRYRAQLALGEQARIEEVDQVLVNTGYGPDDSLYRELQVHESFLSRAPIKLSAALLGAGTGEGVTPPGSAADLLLNPEPDFYILGAKSYGRDGSFLLQTGYGHVAAVMARLAADRLASTPA
jgi:hypothetical protein